MLLFVNTQKHLCILVCSSVVSLSFSAAIGHWWDDTVPLSFFLAASCHPFRSWSNQLLICSESLLLLPLSECRRVCEIWYRPISVWLHWHRLLWRQLHCPYVHYLHWYLTLLVVLFKKKPHFLSAHSCILDQGLYPVQAKSCSGSLHPHKISLVLGPCQQLFSARHIYAICADRWVELGTTISHHLQKIYSCVCIENFKRVFKSKITSPAQTLSNLFMGWAEKKIELSRPLIKKGTWVCPPLDRSQEQCKP